MQPSVQLPNDAGADSKLGLTIVRNYLQSALEPLVAPEKSILHMRHYGRALSVSETEATMHSVLRF